MKIDNIPVVGGIHRTLTSFIVNFILLAVVCLILGIIIPFYPQVLTLLVSVSLILAAIIFISIAYNIHRYKNKYMDWMGK